MKRTAFVLGLHLILIVQGGHADGGTPHEPLTAEAPEVAQPAHAPPYIAPPTPIQSHCEAASLAYLVGKPRTEIPVPVDPTSRRVSCTTCPVTQDYRPERTDILFDAQTGLITEVKCG